MGSTTKQTLKHGDVRTSKQIYKQTNIPDSQFATTDSVPLALLTHQIIQPDYSPITSSRSLTCSPTSGMFEH